MRLPILFLVRLEIFNNFMFFFFFLEIPVAVSFPHFYGGDPSLLDNVNGLSPNQEKHESVVAIQPVMTNYDQIQRKLLKCSFENLLFRVIESIGTVFVYGCYQH